MSNELEHIMVTKDHYIALRAQNAALRQHLLIMTAYAKSWLNASRDIAPNDEQDTRAEQDIAKAKALAGAK